jgi:hypothetical protein
VGSLTPHNPLGLHGLLRGQLYFLFFSFLPEVTTASNRTPNIKIREGLFKIVGYVLFMSLLNKRKVQALCLTSVSKVKWGSGGITPKFVASGINLHTLVAVTSERKAWEDEWAAEMALMLTGK